MSETWRLPFSRQPRGIRGNSSAMLTRNWFNTRSVLLNFQLPGNAALYLKTRQSPRVRGHNSLVDGPESLGYNAASTGHRESHREGRMKHLLLGSALIALVMVNAANAAEITLVAPGGIR